MAHRLPICEEVRYQDAQKFPYSNPMVANDLISDHIEVVGLSIGRETWLSLVGLIAWIETLELTTLKTDAYILNSM